MPVLSLIRDNQVEKEFLIDEDAENIIGRDKNCKIHLDDKIVSRKHAAIKRVGNDIQIQKYSSFGNLKINGLYCNEAILNTNDIIEIGPFKFIFQSKAQSAPAVGSIEEKISSLELHSEELPPASESHLPFKAIENNFIDNPLPVSESENIENFLYENPPNVSDKSKSIKENSLPLLEKTKKIFITDPLEEKISSKPLAEKPSLAALKKDSTVKVPKDLKLFLKFQKNTSNHLEYYLEKEETLIGRTPNCDIILYDSKVSAQHAIFYKKDIKIQLKDLNSQNGTFINDQRITIQDLSHQDIIRLGETEFTFYAQDISFKADIANAPLPKDNPITENPLPQEQAFESFVEGVTLPKIETQGLLENKSLLKKFTSLPLPRQILIVVLFLSFLAWLWLSEQEEQASKKKHKKKATPTEVSIRTFEKLSPEDKKYVATQYELALNYFKNQDYDKAIFEIEKIFNLVDDYKDAREIERYAQEYKKKLEVKLDEEKKQVEKLETEKKIKNFLLQVKENINKKEYNPALDIISQIFVLDPDNPIAASYKKEIETILEQQQLEKDQQALELKLNAEAKKIFENALSLFHANQWYASIALFKKVIASESKDQEMKQKAHFYIQKIYTMIKNLVEPLIQQAIALEKNSESLHEAYKTYEKVLKIDPYHKTAHQGMQRIRGILIQQAKRLYTDGVLAESFSDFDTAAKKFKECLDIAPLDDIYHRRAKNKLKYFFDK